MKLTMFLFTVLTTVTNFCHAAEFSLVTQNAGSTVRSSVSRLLPEEPSRNKFYVSLDGIPRDYKWTAPPIHVDTKITKEMVNFWVKEAMYRHSEKFNIGVDIKFESVNIQGWATYVNHDHFVPASAEGVPEGAGINFNWYENMRPSGPPGAEITENGIFIIWWEYCNFLHLDVIKCKDSIDQLVNHEARHFLQWQKVAMAAMKSTGNKQNTVPSSSDDLSSKELEVLMEKWGDVTHYQCREVEAYTQAVLAKDAPESSLSGHTFFRYFRGCRDSKWTDEFSQSLFETNEIFRKKRELRLKTNGPCRYFLGKRRVLCMQSKKG